MREGRRRGRGLRVAGVDSLEVMGARGGEANGQVGGGAGEVRGADEGRAVIEHDGASGRSERGEVGCEGCGLIELRRIDGAREGEAGGVLYDLVENGGGGGRIGGITGVDSGERVRSHDREADGEDRVGPGHGLGAKQRGAIIELDGSGGGGGGAKRGGEDGSLPNQRRVDRAAEDETRSAEDDLGEGRRRRRGEGVAGVDRLETVVACDGEANN